MTEIDLEALAQVFIRGFPRMNDEEQRLARGLYRALCRGTPVEPEPIAEALGLSARQAMDTLRSWPSVRWDDRGRIVALLGLSIEPTVHRFAVGDGTAYTWCAWDSLFIPSILAAPAVVCSTCPATGADVRLTVGPDGIEWVDPPETGVSFLVPEQGRLGAEVTDSFCRFVYFLRPGPQSASWLAERPELFRLSLAEAFTLGRLVNAARFGAMPLSPDAI